MSAKTELFNKIQIKNDLPEIRPGDFVKVHQRIKEVFKKGKSSKKQEEGGKIQVFEGLVIARKHGKGISSTITVRKVLSGVGVEKIFPLHSPNVEKIEIVKRNKVRRSKLYYLREAKGKKAKLKRKEFSSVIAEETEKKPPAPETEMLKDENEKELLPIEEKEKKLEEK